MALPVCERKYMATDSTADVVILTLVQQLGVQWTRGEQERRLFPLCVQVQAELLRRHGATYRTPDVSQVPEMYEAEVKEMLRAEFLQSGDQR